MAQSERAGRDGEAEFVRQIVTDPRNVPDVMRLYGYLGASSEENHERLYLNPDLSVYVEVPTGTILHRMSASAEQDPNHGVTLWVRRDAALVYKMAPAAQALANYFVGAIAGAAAAGPVPQPWAAQYLGGAVAPGARALPVATPLVTLQPYLCNVTNNCELFLMYSVVICSAGAPCLSGMPGGLCQVGWQSVACAAAAPGAAAMAAASPLTLCAAGGALCTPDCPTYPQRCGGTPICQVTAICQPTRITPCFPPPPPTPGCGGGGTLHVPCTLHPCVPDVAALAAAAPQAAAFGYHTGRLCYPTPACHLGAGVAQRGDALRPAEVNPPWHSLACPSAWCSFGCPSAWCSFGCPSAWCPY
jgi:hypothetical protein